MSHQTTAAQPTMISESRTVERAGAASVRAELQLGAGELTIVGGAASLLEAAFSYNVPGWRPELDYAVRDGQGRLTVRQPEGQDKGTTRNARQHWDLRFADALPLDLRVQVGALTALLTVGGLALEALAIETGAGNLTLDLAGARGPLAVTIKGGVINATIRLPTATGAQVAVRAPVATVDAPGLRRAGHTYSNDAYATADGAVRVTISGGVASIKLPSGESSRERPAPPPGRER